MQCIHLEMKLERLRICTVLCYSFQGLSHRSQYCFVYGTGEFWAVKSIVIPHWSKRVHHSTSVHDRIKNWQDLQFHIWIPLLCSWWFPLPSWPPGEVWWPLRYVFSHCAVSVASSCPRVSRCPSAISLSSPISLDHALSTCLIFTLFCHVGQSIILS